MNPGDLLRVKAARGHLFRVMDLLAEGTEVRARDIDTGKIRAFYLNEVEVTTKKADRMRAGRKFATRVERDGIDKVMEG